MAKYLFDIIRFKIPSLQLFFLKSTHLKALFQAANKLNV